VSSAGGKSVPEIGITFKKKHYSPARADGKKILTVDGTNVSTKGPTEHTIVGCYPELVTPAGWVPIVSKIRWDSALGAYLIKKKKGAICVNSEYYEGIFPIASAGEFDSKVASHETAYIIPENKRWSEDGKTVFEVWVPDPSCASPRAQPEEAGSAAKTGTKRNAPAATASLQQVKKFRSRAAHPFVGKLFSVLFDDGQRYRGRVIKHSSTTVRPFETLWKDGERQWVQISEDGKTLDHKRDCEEVGESSMSNSTCPLPSCSQPVDLKVAFIIEYCRHRMCLQCVELLSARGEENFKCPTCDAKITNYSGRVPKHIPRHKRKGAAIAQGTAAGAAAGGMLTVATGAVDATVEDETPCAVCGDTGEMIMCDHCDNCYHANQTCAQLPPGSSADSFEEWFCPSCDGKSAFSLQASKSKIGGDRKAAGKQKPLQPQVTKIQSKAKGSGGGMGMGRKSSGKGRTRRMRCRQCAGCLRPDCGQCKPCLDKPKFGGNNTQKQTCVLRRCEVVWRQKATADVHGSYCELCTKASSEERGELLCCDSCVLVWHLGCVDLKSVPAGLWHCPRCRQGGNLQRMEAQQKLIIRQAERVSSSPRELVALPGDIAAMSAMRKLLASLDAPVTTESPAASSPREPGRPRRGTLDAVMHNRYAWSCSTVHDFDGVITRTDVETIKNKERDMEREAARRMDAAKAAAQEQMRAKGDWRSWVRPQDLDLRQLRQNMVGARIMTYYVDEDQWFEASIVDFVDLRGSREDDADEEGDVSGGSAEQEGGGDTMRVQNDAKDVGADGGAGEGRAVVVKREDGEGASGPTAEAGAGTGVAAGAAVVKVEEAAAMVVKVEEAAAMVVEVGEAAAMVVKVEEAAAAAAGLAISGALTPAIHAALDAVGSQQMTQESLVSVMISRRSSIRELAHCQSDAEAASLVENHLKDGGEGLWERYERSGVTASGKLSRQTWYKIITDINQQPTEENAAASAGAGRSSRPSTAALYEAIPEALAGDGALDEGPEGLAQLLYKVVYLSDGVENEEALETTESMGSWALLLEESPDGRCFVCGEPSPMFSSSTTVPPGSAIPPVVDVCGKSCHAKYLLALGFYPEHQKIRKEEIKEARWWGQERGLDEMMKRRRQQQQQQQQQQIRGGRGAASAVAGAAAVGQQVVVEEEQWVQCEWKDCQKWRRLPPNMDAWSCPKVRIASYCGCA
jgi:hypothetical protein